MNWPRFHLRDVFWLTLVACIVFGWWSDRRTLEESHSRDRSSWRDTLRHQRANRYHEVEALRDQLDPSRLEE